MDGHELRRILGTHEIISRVYRDDRFPARYGNCNVRVFAATAAWVLGIERPPEGERLKRVCEILGLNNWGFWQVIREDAPRYEPPGLRWRDEGCEAPMIRRDGMCGKRGNWSFRVTSPEDGTWHLASFCGHHREYAWKVRAGETLRQESGGIPEPVPNAGGLLPCYLNWDWPRYYAIARPGWEPPGIGIRADDWPVMAKVTAQEPPRLRVIVNGAESEAAPIPQGDHHMPSLRVVRDDG